MAGFRIGATQGSFSPLDTSAIAVDAEITQMIDYRFGTTLSQA
ncbi:MAG: hypothetical protein R3C68_12460 [Myxococcota bacterium]